VGKQQLWDSYLFQIIWEESYHYRADFSFELRTIKVFQITRYLCMNFSSLGHKFKGNFELQGFELMRFYCTPNAMVGTYCKSPATHMKLFLASQHQCQFILKVLMITFGRLQDISG
jgi:hypothetical protein